MLYPMMKYFGSKWRIARTYPPPRHDTIIEPFAGGAGYSLHYHHKKVVLVEKDDRIASLWQYLIKVSASEIRALPLLVNDDTIETYPLTEEARLLIGFWINTGVTSPCKTPSTWMRLGTHPTCFWGSTIRERIARQVDRIRHWRVIHGEYTDAPDIEAHWFIDPPYQVHGKHYKHSCRDLDFTHLGEWCKTRPGEVIACENAGADWLPFEPFVDAAATPGKYRTGTSREVVWYSQPPLTLFSLA